jgi:hypothetical protein
MDAAYDDHPDVRRAGLEGSVVFQALVRRSKLFGLDGIVSKKYLDVEYLADVLKAPQDFIQRGLVACLRVGLIRDGDGGVTIPGWDRFQSPDTLRKQRYTERHGRDAADGAQQVDPFLSVPRTDENGRERIGTDCPSDVTVRDETGRDETHEHCARARTHEDSTPAPAAPTTPPPDPARLAAIRNEMAMADAQREAESGVRVRPLRVDPEREARDAAWAEEMALAANVAHDDGKILSVYQHWLDSAGLPPRCMCPDDLYMGKTFRLLVLERLRDGLTYDDMKRAITSCHGSKRHQERGVSGWGAILRSLSTVQEFMAIANAKAKPQQRSGRLSDEEFAKRYEERKAEKARNEALLAQHGRGPR